jgi:hypothetical protein
MKSAQKRVAIYLRVSTGEQTTENQRRELEEVATRHGWRVVEFFEDAGISGAKGRDKRPGLDRLLMAFYIKYGFIEFPYGSQTMFLPIETITVAIA